MASSAQLLLQNNQPVTQQLFNSFVSGVPLDFNGHKVQLVDGDTFKVDGQSHRLSGGDAYETDGHSRLLANGLTAKSTPDENKLGDKARFQAAAQMLNNITQLSNNGSQSHGRDVSTATIIDPNKMVKPKNIIDEMLSSGYATPVFSKNMSTIDEMRRENTLAGGTDTNPIVRKFMPNLASDQYRNQFANQVVSRIANRNPNIVDATIGSAVNQLFSNVSSKYNPSIKVNSNVVPMDNEHPELKISRETLKLMTPEENAAADKRYEENTSLSNYLLGTKQVINKAVGQGIIGSLLRAGDEPTAVSRLADKAVEAYNENKKQIDELSSYYKSHGYKGHDTLLTASEVVPELATELATAIPIAGQIGKIGAVANLAEKSLKGRMLAEAIKWGGAEVPASYLTGNQEHLGERVAFGALGGAGVEGLLGVGGKIVSKGAKAYDDAKQAIKDSESKTVNDIKSNPEPIEPTISTEPREYKPNTTESFPNYHNYGKEGTSSEKFDKFNEMYENGDFHRLQDSTIQTEMDRIAEVGKDAVENNYPEKYVDGLRGQYNKLKGILDERKIEQFAKEDYALNQKTLEKLRQTGQVDEAGNPISEDVFQSVKNELKYKADATTPEATTINEVPKVDTNTPEPVADEIKPDSVQAEPTASTNTVQPDSFTIAKANKAASYAIDQATQKVTDIAKTVYNIPAVKDLASKVSGVGKIVKDTLKEVSDSIPPVKQFTDALKAGDESLASAYKNLTSDTSNNYLVKVFNKLSALTANMQKGSAEIAALTRGFTKQLMKDLSDGGKSLREGFTKHYLHTDYNAIKHLNIKSMDDVAKEIASRESVYAKASAEIEQGAKALKDRGAMNSENYYNNAEAIAKAKGITNPEEIRAIDELISLKAIEPKDLEFIAKHGNDDWFKVMQSQTETLANRSRELFESQNQSHNLIKGYYKEVYGKDNYIHDFNEAGVDVAKDMGTLKTIFGIDTKIPANLKLAQEGERVKGAIPLNAQKGTIGSKAIDAKDVTPDMDMSGHRAIRNKDGSVRQYNRVLDEERRRVELNKNYDAADILGDSFQSLYKKSGTDYISNWLKNDGKDLIHIGSKDTQIPQGFTKLSDKEIMLLPKQLRGEVVAVPTDMKHMLMGNAAMGSTEKASLQNLFHNVMREAGQHFKHNVIIANFNAYVTNYVGGVASCLREGMTPMEIYRAFKEGNRLYTSMRSDINRMLYAETVGNKAMSEKILARLNENPLWLMRNEGMAFTMVHDYLSHSGKRSMSHDMAETLLDKIQSNLGKKILDRKDAYNLEDGTRAGEIASLGMSKIDVMPRYSIAMEYLKKNGKSINDKEALTEAVNYSNSIFGNSNKIVPRVVQYLDDVSIVPFGSWMFRVFAGNMKANKENMAQTLGIYVTMKTLGAGMGMHKIANGDPTTIPMNPAKAVNRFGQTNLVTDVLNPFHPPQYQAQAFDAAKSLLK